ncbi:MAG: GUN4 domain-containing protein [Waterburya sp.]
MKFARKIIPLMVGGAVLGSTIVLNILLAAIDSQETRAAVVQLSQALAPEEINLRAKQIIVRIDGASIGSGSIVDYSDNVYTVLTNWHVMKNQGKYIVQTIDGRKHQVIPATIKQLPELDLAVFQFTSNQNYQTAELGDSSNLSEGQNVYFAGYPGELRREDNRYYRFFPANLVGMLPKSTENGYSLIYNGEAFPGMSGGPVFSKDGLMIGVHGEANIHALSGGTSNYAIPISKYQQAIAKLNTQPIAETPDPPAVNPTVAAPTKTPEVAIQPEVESPSAVETNPTSPKADNDDNSEPSETSESIDSDNISSVPTFTPNSSPETTVSETETEPEVIIESEPEEPGAIVTESETSATIPQKQPEVATKPESEVAESEEIDIPSTTIDLPSSTRRISLISQKTGIDYTKLRNLLREKKWSEADIHTYQLIEQIVKSAKLQHKQAFVELKTIAEFSCPDIRTVDYLWKKYSENKFGFSPQQKIWQSVNQKGDFSTQTWRRFATEVGWKKGEVASGSGYILYEQLNFEPTNAPAGHLPWWFALPDEEQNVIKYLFARCNLNPTVEELEAEAKKKSQNTAQNSPNNQPNINKTPKSLNNKANG